MTVPRPSHTSAIYTGIWCAFVLIAVEYFAEPHFEPEAAFVATQILYFLLVSGPVVLFVVGLDETVAMFRSRASSAGHRLESFRRLWTWLGSTVVVTMLLLVLASQF
jgi:hypothetical protein